MPANHALPPVVQRLRSRMDRLNTRLVLLLQARARLALAIGQAKALHGLRASDPARERAMLHALLDDLPPGFPRAALARLLRSLFAASRRLVVADRARRQPRRPRG